jgi:hypothetical protein
VEDLPAEVALAVDPDAPAHLAADPYVLVPLALDPSLAKVSDRFPAFPGLQPQPTNLCVLCVLCG